MAVGFRRDIALFIADAARCRRTVTYGDLALRFGGISRGWGPVLNAIAAHLRKLGHPLLPVLVVAADTGMPSTSAALYRNLGLVDAKAIEAEQRRCYDCNWDAVFSREKIEK